MRRNPRKAQRGMARAADEQRRRRETRGLDYGLLTGTGRICATGGSIECLRQEIHRQGHAWRGAEERGKRSGGEPSSCGGYQANRISYRLRRWRGCAKCACGRYCTQGLWAGPRELAEEAHANPMANILRSAARIRTAESIPVSVCRADAQTAIAENLARQAFGVEPIPTRKIQTTSPVRLVFKFVGPLILLLGMGVWARFKSVVQVVAHTS